MDWFIVHALQGLRSLIGMDHDIMQGIPSKESLAGNAKARLNVDEIL